MGPIIISAIDNFCVGLGPANMPKHHLMLPCEKILSAAFNCGTLQSLPLNFDQFATHTTRCTLTHKIVDNQFGVVLPDDNMISYTNLVSNHSVSLINNNNSRITFRNNIRDSFLNLHLTTTTNEMLNICLSVIDQRLTTIHNYNGYHRTFANHIIANPNNFHVDIVNFYINLENIKLSLDLQGVLPQSNVPRKLIPTQPLPPGAEQYDPNQYALPVLPLLPTDNYDIIANIIFQ